MTLPSQTSPASLSRSSAAELAGRRTLGLFVERDHAADLFWNQCEGPMGRDGDLQLRFLDRGAEHVLVMGTPGSFRGEGRPTRWQKRVGRLMGRSAARTKAECGWAWLGLPPERVSVMFYEPPPIVPDEVYEVARRHAARIYAPDRRATHPIVLPATWSIHEPLARLRAEEPPRPEDKPVALAAVSSGKSLIAGHDARTAFFEKLRRAGIEYHLFGRGLPASLGGAGPVEAKAAALRPARFALAIENHADEPRYVTEKLWDALICWCVPLYYGSGAADGLIPSEAFIRLPDLGDGGVEAVRSAVADPGNWERRLAAIAEARSRALGELRLVAWARRTLF